MDPVRILLVEDNPSDVRLLREALRDLNGSAPSLSDVDTLAKAVEYIHANPCDVVLLDLTLPDSDGFDTLQQMRTAAADMPIVVLTGFDDEVFATKALHMGAQDYLVKGRVDGSLVMRSVRYAIERARTYEDLKTKTGQLRNLFENLDHVFFSFDVKQKQMLQVSHACEKILGLTAETFLEDPFLALEMVHPDERKDLEYSFGRLFEGKGFTAEIRFVHADGEVRWLEVGTKPALDDDGSVLRIDGVISDVTVRKQVEKVQAVLFRIMNASSMTDNLEEFLSAVRGHLGDLLDTTNFFVALYDPATEIYSFPFFADDRDTFGLTRRKLPYSLTDFVRRNGEPLLAGGDVLASLILRNEIKVFGTPAMVWLGVPLKTAQGVIGVMVVQNYKDPMTYTSRDLQLLSLVSGHVAMAIQRKRAMDALVESEAQLRHAQKMEAVGRLAGGVAHDFNNLLTAILGHGELAMLKLHPDDPLRESVEQIMKAADRAASLTRQLLAFSRKQVLQPVVFDLNAVVMDMEKMLRRLIGEDIELITRLDPQLGLVRADVGQIEQVVMNLAVNARDAMPHGGRLVIETAATELDESYAWTHQNVTPGFYTMLAVSDTGCGIAENVLQHIFEPFFTTKEHGKGTGLGLSTVYGIVNQSGGHIWVYSEEARGTAFKVYLPRITSGSVVPPVRTVESLLHGSETILLVEDEDGVRDLVRRILEQRGYTVLAAALPAEAINVAREYDGHIHMLITDIIMPQVNGDLLARHVREIRPGIKVLFMSGYTDDNLNNLDLEGGEVVFLPKPFTAERLARTVRELLDASREAA